MPICSKCSKETHAEYRYCPDCGSKLWLNWDGVVLAKLFVGVELTGKRVHKLAQYRLWRIGKELGFFSITEFAVPDLVQKGRTSLIDVVWKTEDGIEFAFEIRTKAQELDLVTTRKDTMKLQNLSARKKFIVNVSNKTGKAYFNQITGEPNELIMVIQNKSYNLDEIRRKHPRAYENWTDNEDFELSKCYQEGLSISLLAEKHQRNRGAIRSRLKKLGLMKY